jgi:hypothetical protein
MQNALTQEGKTGFAIHVNPNIILAKIQELSWWKHLIETQALTRSHQDNYTDSTSLMLGFTAEAEQNGKGKECHIRRYRRFSIMESATLQP